MTSVVPSAFLQHAFTDATLEEEERKCGTLVFGLKVKVATFIEIKLLKLHFCPASRIPFCRSYLLHHVPLILKAENIQATTPKPNQYGEEQVFSRNRVVPDGNILHHSSMPFIH